MGQFESCSPNPKRNRRRPVRYTWGQYAVGRMKRIEKSDRLIGSEVHNPDWYPNRIPIHCTNFITRVLAFAYAQIGEEKFARRIGAQTDGKDIAQILCGDGHKWTPWYWNPDVNHPSGGPDKDKYLENTLRYIELTRNGKYYGVPIQPAQWAINFRPRKKGTKEFRVVDNYKSSGIITEETPVDRQKFNELIKFPFAVGICFSGWHLFLLHRKYIYEAHWRETTPRDVVDTTRFYDFAWKWGSGMVLVPPRSLMIRRHPGGNMR